jgi:hypothetical protein
MGSDQEDGDGGDDAMSRVEAEMMSAMRESDVNVNGATHRHTRDSDAPEVLLVSEEAAPAPTSEWPRKGEQRSNGTMPLIFVTAEVAPWSKTGGLGDVCGALPAALAARGHAVRMGEHRGGEHRNKVRLPLASFCHAP